MRRIRVYTIFALLMFFSISVNNLNDDYKDIINYLNDGNMEVFKYVDLDNELLYKQIKSTLGKCNISYNGDISYKELDNNQYLVGAYMTGSGKVYNSSWSINNLFITFKFEYDEKSDNFIIIDTDFFDKTGISILRKMYSELFVNVLVVSFLIFVVIMIISYRIYKRAMEDEIK